ncbi:MAG: hypothetical protein LRZ98_00460 [Candidatus Pacebacteria bacterium]|nr:hypothetical protein [Candidatus Paceibacterota bacterium]
MQYIKNKNYVIFHISSMEIIGSVVNIDEEKKISEIFFTEFELIKFEKNFNFDNFLKNIESSIEKISDSLLDYLMILKDIEIDKIFIFLTAPLIKENFFTLKDERINPFLVTEKYLENFINNTEKKEKNEILLKTEITSIKSNDYDVLINNLINKKMSSLEISLFNTKLSKKIEKKIDGLIKSKFPFLENIFLGFIPSFLSEIKEIYDIDNDFIFINFSGEYFDFGVFINNKIEFLITQKGGFNNFLRKIIDNGLAKNLEEAKYLFSLYNNNELEKEERKKINIIVKNENKKMEEFLLKNLKEKTSSYIPKKVFAFTPFGMKSIMNDFTIFKDIVFVDYQLLRNFIIIEDKKNFNPFIVLAVNYILKNNY